jgi:hypothetical protein
VKEQQSHQPPASEAASPALDVSVLEDPSPRLKIEIVQQKAENYIAQYIELLSNGDESVRQFATEKWPSLYALFQAAYQHNGVSTIQEGYRSAQEFPPLPSIPYYFPANHKSSYSDIMEKLSEMKRPPVCDSREPRGPVSVDAALYVSSASASI